MQKRSNGLKSLGVVIILIQLFDVIIHVATGQPELIRIISNMIIVVWVVVVLAGWLKDRFQSISFATIGTYFVLNLIFLAQNGLTNPEQGDAPRTTLFVLVFLTVTLSTLLTFRVPVSEESN